MGIFQSFTNETKRNFVARPQTAYKDIIYMHPEKNLPTVTQVTCRPGEVAIFVNDGNVAGKLGPGGRYSLETNNLPFLSNLLHKGTGGNLFIAQVYFVSMQEVSLIRFGGELDEIYDPVTRVMYSPTIHGDFSVRVIDPEKLLCDFIGWNPEMIEKNAFLLPVKEQVIQCISQAIASLQSWSIADMISAKRKSELVKLVLDQVGPQIEPNGLQLVKFGNFTISLPEDQKKVLNNENLAQLHQDRSERPGAILQAQAEMIRGAGQGLAQGGESSGNALAGFGLGLGMQMCNPMGGIAQGFQRPVAVPQGQAIPCPSCGQMTPPGKFCVVCGKPLGAKCECGADLVPGGKFCTACGRPAAAGGGPRKCACGTELSAGTKFCPSCGKSV